MASRHMVYMDDQTRHTEAMDEKLPRKYIACLLTIEHSTGQTHNKHPLIEANTLCIRLNSLSAATTTHRA